MDAAGTGNGSLGWRGRFVRRALPSGRHLRLVVGRLTYTFLLMYCMSMMVAQAPAHAVAYVDGLSDQQMIGSWHDGLNGESYFTNFFSSTWLPAGHIKYARYAVQWNAFQESPTDEAKYAEKYRAWCQEAKSLNLTLDIAPTAYPPKHEGPPKTTAKYKETLQELVKECSGITYVEAWNEPNGTPTFMEASLAAADAIAAYEVCKEHGCHVIAGDFVDWRSTSEIAKYEDEYASALKGLVISDWAIHPYTSVDEETFSKVQEFINHFPQAKKLWFTEVGAYKCYYYSTRLFRTVGEQAEHANWLVNQLAPHFNPDHIFYYEFVSNEEEPTCPGPKAEADTALYVRGGDPFAFEQPRPAAAYIYANSSFPWAYTGPLGESQREKRWLEPKGSVYPGGLPTYAYIQYGLTTAYELGHTAQQEMGGSGRATIEPRITGLEPNKTYHFRVYAWNSGGADSSKDETATTKPAPPEISTWGGYGITRTSAVLKGVVMPDTLSTKYWFVYKEIGGANQETERKTLSYTDEAWHEVEIAATSLKSCTTYETKLIAENVDATVEGTTKTFATNCSPPSVAGEPAREVQRTSAKLEGQVSPNGIVTTYWFEYGKVGSFESRTSVTEVGRDNTWHWESNTVSLKSCTEYQARLVAENEDSKKADPGGVVVGATETFKTECWPPSVKPEAAQEVKRRSATMEGEVYPNGLPTKYWFEYGKKGSFESNTSAVEAGGAKSWYGEHATISSFNPCTEYQFRIVAENEDALEGPPKGLVYGETEYFATKCKPLIRNVKVSHLESGSVVLEAEVNPEEAETMYHFEYDAREYKQNEAAHGTSVPSAEVSAGSGVTFVKESIAVVKLIPGQIYYFNLATHNESGVTTSESWFKTPVDWELNGKSVETTSPIKGEGRLVVSGVECAVVVGGKATIGEGEVSSVSCPGVLCEGSSEVEPVNVPWKTELVDVPVRNGSGEVERYEVRERFYGASGKEPGWDLVCKGKVMGSCVGEMSGNVENAVSGVAVEFDALSPKMSCSGFMFGPPVGAIVFSSSEEGKTLSVYGAPKGPLRPVVVTGSASEVSGSGAKVKGSVVARGVATTYRFEYGTTTKYGSSIPVPDGSAGEGRLPAEVTQTITGLQSSTLYHYRLVATNGGGTSYGEDKTLATTYPPKWLVNGQAAFLNGVKSEGTLIVKDTGLEVTAECAIDETGETVLTAEGKIAKVTNTTGGTMITCHAIQSGWCGTAPIEVTAANLPWKTELIDVPIENSKGEVHYEARNRFYGTTTPGLTIKCAFMGSVATDTCLGETSGTVKNVTAGVTIGLDPKSPALTCTGSAIGTGSIEGTLTFKSTEEGKTLSVYGAPNGP